MNNRRFRPAQEELTQVILGGLLCCVWYAILLEQFLRDKFRSDMLIFMLAGLPLLYTTVIDAQRAFFYRKQRKNAIQLGHVRKGQLVNVLRTSEVQRTRRGQRTINYYFYEVEVTDAYTGASAIIKSDAYNRPIHRYLGSPEVKVYTDSTGWKHYLEEFQLKEHRSDPDIFPEAPRFKAPLWGRSVYNIIYILLLALMLFRIFRPGS